MEQPTVIVVAFRYGKIITYVASEFNGFVCANLVATHMLIAMVFHTGGILITVLAVLARLCYCTL